MGKCVLIVLQLGLSETSISGGFLHPPLIVSPVLLSLRSSLSLRSIDSTNPIGSTKPLKITAVSFNVSHQSGFYGQLSSTYASLSPLSLEVGFYCPLMRAKLKDKNQTRIAELRFEYETDCFFTCSRFAFGQPVYRTKISTQSMGRRITGESIQGI